MRLISIFGLFMLIGTSMQAPKPQSIEDETVNRLQDGENEQTSHVKDETTSGTASSSIDREDQGELNSTSDEPRENDSSNESIDGAGEDSVALFIKKNTVSRLPQATLTNPDSVESYISLEDQDTGVLRDEIPVKNNHGDVNEDTSSDHEDISSGLQGDSVASYINQQQVNGNTKNTIASRKHREKDSVASYIGIGKGLPRHRIPESGGHNEPVSPSTHQNLEPEQEPKTDSVGSYINLVDHDKQQVSELSTDHEESGQELEASGELDSEEDLSSRKTQDILQGLENVSTEERKKVEFGNKKMNELSPDVIVPHKMIGEFWLDRSVAPTTSPLNNKSNDDQMLNDELNVQPQYTYVSISQAEHKGAVCLDGSAPGFFFRRGVESGQNKWIIYLQGGAWCHSKLDCYERSKSNLGSSLKFNKLVNVEGLLSRESKANPNFYNWNVVYVPYCDGASYTGNRTKPLEIEGKMIYFRGKRILSALVDDLLGYGMNEAEKVIFSGTSAGGLSVLLHSDYVRSRIPSSIGLYSLADAGVFLNVANLKKQNEFGNLMSDVYKLHGSSKSINHKCAVHNGKANAWKCLFPYYFGKYIHSPVFIVNPLYDSWQLGNVIGIHCVTNLHRCSRKEMRAIIKFRTRTLESLKPLMSNPNISLFADGCFDHGQITFGPKWNYIRVRNRSMSGAFVRWMLKEEHLKDIVDPDSEDELFNPTCVTHQVKISKKSFTSS